MGFTHWTPTGARLELMISTVNVVLKERTAPSHILTCTRRYKAGKESSIAVGMTPIRVLVIYIGRIAIWHCSSGIRHSTRWQPVVTALVREVLLRPMKGMEISPTNLTGRVHPVAMVLLSTNQSVVRGGFLPIINNWLWGEWRWRGEWTNGRRRGGCWGYGIRLV